MSLEKSTDQLYHAELVAQFREHFLSVACPICAAEIGEPCQLENKFHIERGTGETVGQCMTDQPDEKLAQEIADNFDMGRWLRPNRTLGELHEQLLAALLKMAAATRRECAEIAGRWAVGWDTFHRAKVSGDHVAAAIHDEILGERAALLEQEKEAK